MGGVESSFVADLGADFPAYVKFFKFRNLTNTCYCNSVLQTLLFSKHVNCYFTSLGAAVKEMELPPKIAKSPLIQLLHTFASRKKQADPDEREIVVRPGAFLDAVYRHTDQFTKGYQHDAHELFLFLIASFDETTKLMNEVAGKTVMPPFSKLFEGIRVSTFECMTCGKVQEIREAFTSLDIAIVPDTDLQNLIDESLCPEDMDSDWKCEQCNEKREARIMSHMAQLPPVLLVQLQRFKYDKKTGQMAKLSQFVGIPEELLLNSGTGPQCYKLSSIVVHLGASLRSGHFMAILRVFDKWILANDDQLSVHSAEEVTRMLTGRENGSRTMHVPYILIYEC